MRILPPDKVEEMTVFYIRDTRHIRQLATHERPQATMTKKARCSKLPMS